MREKIIDTAIEEFTRNGLKFTMNDVAKALGISKKTIYTVFESKQDVLMAIADRYARDFTDMRQEIEADTELDTLEKLERLAQAGVDLNLHIVHRGDMAPAALANARGYTETGFDS